MDLSKETIIPKPVLVEPSGSSFRITKHTKILADSSFPELKKEAEYLAEFLRPATGFPLPVLSKAAPSGRCIFLTLSGEKSLGAEGYQLQIEEKEVILKAETNAGIFHGIQTFRQLLPLEIEQPNVLDTVWDVASGTITDQPAYGFRSMMLDVSRHFFGVEDVKEVIEWLARYKMNILHLHLSDDQGWRIEIKKWPKLTEIGGSTEVGGGEGGFYTQEQFMDIVAYADERHITIVPEIDMPGHTNAALASYAFLNCDDQLRELYTGTEVGFSTFCTQKDTVYSFVNDVVAEISAMIKGPWFHIGGDESHVTAKDDYIFFVERVQGIVEKNGKEMIGWDEIANARVSKSSLVQAWANEENAGKGVAQGNKLIMSPASRTYLDMKYDSTTQLGLKWAGYIEVDHAYNWDPDTVFTNIGADQILGVECPLWTETITNMDEMEFMVFPRLPGYAEIGWTPGKTRNWEEYKNRLAAESAWFRSRDIDFYASPRVTWPER